jgi:nicotinamide-nucleotide amidase
MGTHDQDTAQALADAAEIASAISDNLASRTIASAESMTAGRIGAAIACVESAADFYRGSIVPYQEQIKRNLLGVTASSVFSPSAAEQMAIGASRLLDADVTVATTGLAGGSPQDGVPVGTVFIATSIDGDVRSRSHHFDGEPEEVCDAATRQALIDLLERLTE